MIKTDTVIKVLIFDKDKILLIKRSNTDTRRPMQWDFPGGILENNEYLEEGAIREVEEETGLLVNKLKPIYTKSEINKWADENGNHTRNVLRLFFRATYQGDVIKLSHEHCEFSWVSIIEAKNTLDYMNHKEVIEYLINNQLEL